MELVLSQVFQSPLQMLFLRNIGVVGASGTGIQEVTTIIDRLGGGVVHAIGTGGRDLSDKVGAITVKDAIVAFENHEPTDVITVISKPPAKKFVMKWLNYYKAFQNQSLRFS